MSIGGWMKRNTESLAGQKVVVFGSTGGIGRELCRHLAALGADLILADRNEERSRLGGESICREFPDVRMEYVTCDLEDIDSVKAACARLEEFSPYAVIHNAGAYSIPRHKCSTGLDNVFQINFASPYYITKRLLPVLRRNGGRIVAVGSIAHNYSKSDATDVDFSTRKKASLVYGNAKRHLMCSLWELFREEKDVSLSVTHPGITFTNITAHYPKLIFAVIKHPMKVIFMKPKTAALCVLRGLFEKTEHRFWIGPAIFDVWGLPKKTKLATVSDEESRRIFDVAEEIFGRMDR